MIKVLHLSTGDNLGAFTGAYRVHRSLTSIVDESVMFVAHKSSNDLQIVSLGKFNRLKFNVFSIVWKLINKFFFKISSLKEHYFLNDYFGISVKEIKNNFSKGYFDYIFIYYTSNFLSINQIDDLVSYFGATVVFYPMDMGPLTGGCHYSWGCEGYHSECGSCPSVKTNTAKKIIANNFNAKQYFNHRNSPFVLAGSQLIYRQASSSQLFKNENIIKCLLPIDENVYTPKNRGFIRKHYEFKEDDIVIYYGAQSTVDPRKGVSLLLEALKLLSIELTQAKLNSIVLLSIGSNKPCYDFNNIRTIHLNFIADQDIFSKIYSGVDLFISPSVEDSGPMMVNESVLSGTPVLAFETGVALDLIESEKSGYLCGNNSFRCLKDKISSFVSLTAQEREKMRNYSRKKALDLTSTKVFKENMLRFFQGL